MCHRHILTVSKSPPAHRMKRILQCVFLLIPWWYTWSNRHVSQSRSIRSNKKEHLDKRIHPEDGWNCRTRHAEKRLAHYCIRSSIAHSCRYSNQAGKLSVITVTLNYPGTQTSCITFKPFVPGCGLDDLTFAVGLPTIRFLIWHIAFVQQDLAMLRTNYWMASAAFFLLNAVLFCPVSCNVYRTHDAFLIDGEDFYLLFFSLFCCRFSLGFFCCIEVFPYSVCAIHIHVEALVGDSC